MSGSIAAFKAAKLASDLVGAGYEVRAVLTAGASRFITPLTFQAITGNPVPITVWDDHPGASAMGHLELARWLDLLVVAPATAGILARLALGLADDMLGAVALASASPMLLAPAMETGMWHHPATKCHVRTLTARGATLVGPRSGRLASGAEGEGRMAEPDEIFEAIGKVLEQREDLRGLRALVTAGPTYEAIDPVRFIGNRSSGKMGYAIAREARRRGAEVVLISGPTALKPPAGVTLLCVESTAEMRQSVLQSLEGTDVVVMAAAVADFRPSSPSASKIKRSDGQSIELTATTDIAAEASAASPWAFHVGFALESEDLLDKAREKLQRKGLDLVVANGITRDANPFGSDSNVVALVTPGGVVEYPEMPKAKVAELLWDEVATAVSSRKASLRQSLDR